MPPKLAFSANAYKRTDFFDAAADIAAAGYKALEVYADAPHLYPLDAPPDLVARAAEHIRSLGLAVSNVNAFTMFAAGDTWRPSFIDPDEDRRALRIDHTVAALRMARALGAATVSTEPGGPLDEAPDRAAALELFARGVEQVIERTGDLDVLLLVEPEPGLLVQDSAGMEEFFERVPHPRVAMNLDIGHFFCVGEDPARVVRDFCGRFDHVHIEDIAADRRHFHLVPGDGAVDFRSVFEALAEIGYDGFVTVELYPYEETPGEAARRALERLAPVWRETFGEEPA